ncbi:MAG: cobyrinate a,c-diamide synthase [Lachnospiraceae bacterium]|nr:cobyrinate a,c-diamide synthase [Lachnospiraceae bacterium]
MNRIPRIVIAAPQSGSGKTLLTCALLEHFKRNGKNVMSYKCGPDYIDPMFHSRVIGVPSCNLDLFFLKEGELRALFVQRFRETESELALVEGVMGLYDGLGGSSQEASTYHVAASLEAPIILVVNARGMGRSLLPLLSGFLQYDTGKLIKGVILNQTGKAFYERMKEEVERNLPITVLGYFPTTKELHLESRHLGLKLPEEIEELQQQLALAADSVEQSVDLEALWRIAHEAGHMDEGWEVRVCGREESEAEEPREKKFRTEGLRVKVSGMGASRTEIPVMGDACPILAVARDEVFCFYYEENLRMLEQAGVRLVPFSPLHDKALPEGTCGILLGGGYPELRVKELAENISMLQSIRAAIRDGVPSVAECGGFLYLHETLGDEAQGEYKMVGVIPGRAVKQSRLVRFGYVEIAEKATHFLPPGETIRGHEFHYYDSENNGTDCTARKPVGGREWECIQASEKHWWGFPHLYYRSNPAFVRHFVEEVKKRSWRKN